MWMIKLIRTPARPVGFSKVIPTWTESHRQWLQYKKKGGSFSEVTGIGSRLSPVSGGSEGTTDRVFLQFGHMKQLRAHL